MADIKKSNWADEDDIDSDEADGEFGLEATKQEQIQRKTPKEPEVCLTLLSLWNRLLTNFYSFIWLI